HSPIGAPHPDACALARDRLRPQEGRRGAADPAYGCRARRARGQPHAPDRRRGDRPLVLRRRRAPPRHRPLPGGPRRLTLPPPVVRITIVADPTVEIPTRTLVFGMVGEDGTVAAADLYAVAEACGQSAEQVRSCLRRLVTEGLLIRSGGSGRDASFELTPDGMAALGAIIERTRLAYGQDAAGRGWDRQWRLVAFAVPEQNRVARDAFRDQLRALGGAAIQGALYLSPHQWHKDVKSRAERLG